jgi:hypothetical protein
MRREGDDHKKNTGMLINFNYGQSILIGKNSFHTLYEILTYSSIILAS